MATLAKYLAVAACVCATTTYAAPKFENNAGNVVISVDDASKDITFSLGPTTTSVKGILAEFAGVRTAAAAAKTALDETIKTTLVPLEVTTSALNDTVHKNRVATDNALKKLGETIAKHDTQYAADKTAQTTINSQIDTAFKAADTAANKAFQAAMVCVAKGQAFDATTSKCKHVDDGAVKPNFQVPQQYMSDRRQNGCWQTNTGRRDIPVVKASKTSWMKVTYADSFGYYGRYTGRGGKETCKWRMSLNGKSMGEHISHSYGTGGWTIGSMTLFSWFAPTDLVGGRPSTWYKKYATSDGSLNFNVESCRPSTGVADRCLQGWAGNQQDNSLVFQEIEPAHVAVKRKMKGVLAKGTAWATVAEREVSYKVKGDKSMLTVEYNDAFGAYRAKTGRACDVRIMMNNVDVFAAYYSASLSDRSGSTTWPTSMRWTIPAAKLKKDATYKFTLQVKRYTNARECVFGNSFRAKSDDNSLTVQELTVDTQKLMATTAAGSFKMYSTTAGGWKSIPSRLVVYTKQAAASILKITYADTIGYNMNGRQTTSMRVRVLINGKTMGTRMHWHHSGVQKNYNEGPKILTWICTGCTFKGKATVQIQADRQGGASGIRFGYPSGKVGDVTVEEIPVV